MRDMLKRVMLDDAAFTEAVQTAVARNEHNVWTQSMPCPFCKRTMYVERHPVRRTRAGWEMAYVEYQCAFCQLGGSYEV